MRSPCTLLITIALLAGSAIGVDAEEAQPPSATELMLAGMVTEEVEPGVSRVVNDGVRDLVFEGGDRPGPSVDTTPGDGVWLTAGGATFRLGDAARSPLPAGWSPDIEVGPDGSLWSIDIDRGTVLTFDGLAWTEVTEPTGLRLMALAVGPDGTVWATARDDSACSLSTDYRDCVDTALLRLDDDGALTPVDGWTDAFDGFVAYDELAVSPDGDVWLIGMDRRDGPEAEALLRFDGDEWEVIAGPGRFVNHPFGNSLDIGPDGTLWVNASTGYSGANGVGGLARFDDPGWTVFTEPDGVRNWGGQGFIATDLLRIAPDGSLWMNGAPGGRGCGGVAHYDGEAWTSYLRPHCVHDIAIAADGSAFVGADLEAVAWEDATWDMGLYVITPRNLGFTGAAATEPLSTGEASTTAVELPASIVPEEVEPGVLRLVSDGRFDLTQAGWDTSRTVIAPDGSAWMFGPESFFRLGSEGDLIDWPVGWPNDTGFAANGDIWAAYPGAIRVFDGRDWSTRMVDVAADQIEFAGDGKAWVQIWDEDEGSAAIGWFEPDDAVFVPARSEAELGYSIIGVGGAPIGLAAGGAWSVLGRSRLELYRWATGEWEIVSSPSVSSAPGYGVLDIGPDGTVWMAHCPSPGCWGPWANRESVTLARLEGSEWQESVHLAHGLAVWGIERVAPDGAIWGPAAPIREDRCSGIVRFDGEASMRWLDGHCIEEIEVGHDGSAWVQAFERSTPEGTNRTDDRPVETYVITPEATDQ